MCCSSRGLLCFQFQDIQHAVIYSAIFVCNEDTLCHLVVLCLRVILFASPVVDFRVCPPEAGEISTYGRIIAKAHYWASTSKIEKPAASLERLTTGKTGLLVCSVTSSPFCLPGVVTGAPVEGKPSSERGVRRGDTPWCFTGVSLPLLTGLVRYRLDSRD